MLLWVLVHTNIRDFYLSVVRGALALRARVDVQRKRIALPYICLLDVSQIARGECRVDVTVCIAWKTYSCTRAVCYTKLHEIKLHKIVLLSCWDVMVHE
jgi:hypothetical protein